MLELAKEAVASGSPAAQQFTEQLDEIGSPTHGARRHATQAALSQLSQPAAPFARPLLHALYSPYGDRVRPALTLSLSLTLTLILTLTLTRNGRPEQPPPCGHPRPALARGGSQGGGEGVRGATCAGCAGAGRGRDLAARARGDPTLASAPSTPPNPPLPPDFSRLSPCPSRPLPPPPLPLRLLPERHSCHLTPARLCTLRSALSTHAQS